MRKCITSNTLKFFVFVFLLWQFFAHLTYLYRNASDDRIRILSFDAETENSLDMVYIGGSNVFVFWNPMVAWQQYGITSYDYAMSNMPAATYLPSIKEVLKRQAPKVIVVDARMFLSPIWSIREAEGIKLGGYRSITDSWDISMDRIRAIKYYCELNRITIKEALSSYIDLMYYHTNGGYYQISEIGIYGTIQEGKR